MSALERGERRRPYPHTVRALADALGLAEAERASLIASVPRRGAEDPAPDWETVVPTAVPVATLPSPHTPLVGRERELAEIESFLRDRGVRLLTLTGTGGVGKTRLALGAARRAAPHFPDGVVFVALASLGDPALVLPTIAQSLGLREAEHRTPRQAVRFFLREKRFLLVLDNLEHLLEAAPEVADLTEDCPGLCVFVTSRAPLRVRGEQEYPVGPLALPASTLSPDPEEVLASPSGRLFAERATAASPAFELSGTNAGAVAAICWRLDGLPLALELAAAKARFLDPQTLLSRLDRALSAGWARDLPERQRTMRAALDWSHDLLDAAQRELFGRLSVFAGGFTLEAAEAVGSGGEVAADEVIYVLEGLVEQSLVTAGPDADGGGVRYGMLEPVRQYALERLEESGAAQEVRGRHAAYYLALMERGGPELRGREQAMWLGRLETELDNLRAALSWSVEHAGGPEIARTFWTSWTYWWLSGHISEGCRWAEEALAREPEMPASPRATLLFVAATLGQALGDFDAAKAMNDESMEIYGSLGDDVGYYYASGTAGLIALGQGRHDEALSLMEDSGEKRLAMGDRWPAAAMFGFSATVALGMGDRERARRLAERSVSLGRELGAREAVSVALPTLATIARADGDHERARKLFAEGLLFSAEVGDGTNVAYYLEGLATLAAESEPERAARLWGAAEAVLEQIEVISYPHAADRSFNDRQLAAARESLDERAWDEAWNEGRAMTTEEAVAYALEPGGELPQPREASGRRAAPNS